MPVEDQQGGIYAQLQPSCGPVNIKGYRDAVSSVLKKALNLTTALPVPLSVNRQKNDVRVRLILLV